MRKAVMISIRPKWCEKIARGEKTIEVRKSRPKLETPFKCYIYQTKNGKAEPELIIAYGKICGRKNVNGGTVIGEFICTDFVPFCNGKPILMTRKETVEEIERRSCLSREQILEYEPKGNPIGWCISDLVIYDKPKDLSDFRLYYCSVVQENGYPIPTHEIRRPPQSWCYVEEVQSDG